jgi:hypothetical protein
MSPAAKAPMIKGVIVTTMSNSTSVNPFSSRREYFFNAPLIDFGRACRM